LTYRLAAELAGVTYKTLNEWNQKGRQRNLGNIISLHNISKKCNAEGAKKLLDI